MIARSLVSDVALPARAEFMPTGEAAADAAPQGFLSFCTRAADQCEPSSATASILRLNASTWTTIERVNLRVNNSIKPQSDKKHYGVAEYWTIDTDGYGDCKDYALTKRKELIDADLPERALRIAVVVTLRNEQHAVLTVATDRGDFVLDNLTNDILPWNQTGYAWIARQDSGGRLGWVAYNGSARPVQPAATSSAN